MCVNSRIDGLEAAISTFSYLQPAQTLKACSGSFLLGCFRCCSRFGLSPCLRLLLRQCLPLFALQNRGGVVLLHFVWLLEAQKSTANLRKQPENRSEDGGAGAGARRGDVAVGLVAVGRRLVLSSSAGRSYLLALWSCTWVHSVRVLCRKRERDGGFKHMYILPEPSLRQQTLDSTKLPEESCLLVPTVSAQRPLGRHFPIFLFG